MTHKPAHVLPLAAARLLQLAAQTPNVRGDPLARQKAIEKATQQVKRNHPEFFHKEQ